MSNQNQASFRDALDIVFADRNRLYGAYQLRRRYPVYLGRALSLGLLLIGFGVVLPQITRAVSAMMPAAPPMPTAYEFIDAPPPPTDPVTPPPPVVTPPPPTPSTTRFVPPVVLQDDEVTQEQQAAQDDILDKEGEIGKETKAGNPEAPPDIIDNPELVAAVEAPKKREDDEVHEIFSIQKPPTFPGGDKELVKFLAENIKYPALARENNIQGNVALSFVVGKDGTVSDIYILKDIGGGCGKEAVRVVGAMPKWIPGEANGNAVKVRFQLPVRFRLE